MKPSLRCLAVCLWLCWSGTVAAQESSTPRARAVMQPVVLFNGRDLSGFTTWLKDDRHEDPSHVFSVENGAIRISGTQPGYLATKDSYRDYHLVAEYKWGTRTDGGKYVRNSGILLHATGPDGSAGNGTWMASIECQLAQGCVGDLIPIRGKIGDTVLPVTFQSEIRLGPDRRPRWSPGGEVREFTNRQLWWSRHDPEFQELLDTRGRFDVESPLGDWTKVECVCRGDRITVLVNGQPVNACFHASPSEGKILLQSEGFEIYFRKLELHPLSGDDP